MKAGGHSLYLSVDAGTIDSFAAINVVIGKLGAHDDVLYAQIGAIASGTTARHDGVGMMFANHLRRTDGSVHLADSTLLDNITRVVAEHTLQRVQLLLHCNNDSYLHTDFVFNDFMIN